jgi:hypothetical protein
MLEILGIDHYRKHTIKREIPYNAKVPEGIKDLMAEDGNCKCHAKEGMPPVPQNKPGKNKNHENKQGMPDRSGRSEQYGSQHGRRFIEKIGKEGAGNTYGKCPPVPGQGQAPYTQEKTGEEVGKERYPTVPPVVNEGYRRRKLKKLHLALLISSSVVQGFLQDLDIGDVMLAQ